MKIRQATKKDFKQYLKLRKEDMLEYPKIVREKIKISQNSQIKKEFSGILKSNIYIILVAEEDGQLVGHINGSITKNIWQHSGYIDDIFVTKNFKQQGIGTHLIKSFIKFLKTKNIKRCKISVNIKNKKAIKLYKKLGFKIYHYEMDITM